MKIPAFALFVFFVVNSVLAYASGYIILGSSFRDLVLLPTTDA